MIEKLKSRDKKAIQRLTAALDAAGIKNHADWIAKQRQSLVLERSGEFWTEEDFAVVPREGF